MEWEFIRSNWAIVWALFMSAVNLIQMFLAKTYVKREEIELLKIQIQSIQSSISALPSQKELHQLQLEISSLRGELLSLGPKLQQVQRISDLLLENELKDK
ncbi:DUF2730 family protein [Yersinia enterocolitica]|uniref:Protein of uncharacterized function (DUF2730) n=1 Tax=Yersinia enterocolitica TaxID=630 RepID=A0A0H5G417_YEREN|nr:MULTISPECIES: DUF2730 family protein [Yersinia]EKN3329255.1 DUF2730 family protein [Yersinia enterocolitica]EKN3387498.1 DUF2730 family protein [Yersinia enterocolitica]EKN3392340.1 DUF2730 family protein [Yersinia enterocolitica]EKN3412799.1 DUF2730 family protein [Yersinia enterocolitica]EKN3486043.1 DUF2730 family protein [Yersinia enterocolitica]